MVKPRRSGHGDTVKRQLTPTQKRTLKNRGQITVTIQLDGVRYHKTVRPRNIRGGAWEYYRRSDNHLMQRTTPAGRSIGTRDAGTTGREEAGVPKRTVVWGPATCQRL
jgi:hypothetical protein